MKQQIQLGFSPCPNDTFIFDALVNGKLNSDIVFRPVLKDVERLNQSALNGELDVTKISVNAFAYASSHYEILDSGSALGKNCGPLLISKKEISFDKINSLKIAIPGLYTTANLLLSIFAPNAKNKKEMVFSSIEEAVLNNECDAGLIIHENRFTYQERGLKKIADMGELWEQATGCPIPLGCIAVKRSLDNEVKKQINRLIRESVEYAFAKPDASWNYVKQHSQEMSDEVCRNHIALYVNDYSIDLGTEGKRAIELLLQKGFEAGLLPEVKGNIFLNR